MNRNLFIKNIGLSIAAAFAGQINTGFSKKLSIKKANLQLSAINGSGKFVQIKGKFLDAATLENISGFISVQKDDSAFKIKCKDLSKTYSIENELGNSFSEKITFEITARGYKTFEGQLLIAENTVNIDTNIWNYNPNFDAKNRPKNHKIENGILSADFDFHLVKD